MPPSLKCYADYLSMGLLLGLCSVSEVVAWADRLIEESDRPLDWMIDLSLSANKHPLDNIRILNSIPGTENLEISFRLLIAKLGVVYPILFVKQDCLTQSQRRRLFRGLWSLVPRDNSLPEEIIGGIFLVYDDFDGLDYGYRNWSTVNQDYQELLALDESYKEFINFSSV